MAQFPVTSQEGLIPAINYLLSGPGGLGQNFAGFSSYDPAYLTGTFRAPFTISTTATSSPPSWYVAPVGISHINTLNVVNSQTNIIQVILTTASSQPLFSIGDSIEIIDVVPDYYNDSYNRSVEACSTTATVLQLSNSYTWPAYVSGGHIYKDLSNTFNSTDCDVRVNVNGPTDTVFMSCQLIITNFTYFCSMASQFDIQVAVNRYSPTTTAPLAPGADYLFNFDKTIGQQVFHYSTATSGTATNLQTIFTTILDQPGYGYYRYICEVSFNNADLNGNAYPGNVTPGVFTVGLRNMTAQVIKA